MQELTVPIAFPAVYSCTQWLVKSTQYWKCAFGLAAVAHIIFWRAERPLLSRTLNGSITPQSATGFRYAQENMADTNNHRCGSYKCFYPLTASIDGAKRVGYVSGTDPWLERSL